MVTVYRYITGRGERRYSLDLSPHGVSDSIHLAYARRTTLTEAEARELLGQLTVALREPPECRDCASPLHSSGSASCHVANAEERDCED